MKLRERSVEAPTLSTLRSRLPRASVVSVYGSAFTAGVAVVSFPASANHLRQLHGLNDAQYGAIFLPQLALSIAGALLGSVLARRWQLSSGLKLAMLALILSQGALALTEWLSAQAYALLLSGTALCGLGFGLSAAPLNALPGRLFPARGDVALVALHTLLGAGFALAPIPFGMLAEHKIWIIGPVASALLGLKMLALSALTRWPMQHAQAPSPSGDKRAVALPSSLLLFLVIAVLYALCEGTFSGWASVFLHDERAVAESSAALALSVFWAAVVAARLLVTLLLWKVSARALWRTLLLLMSAAFLLLPRAYDASSGALLFAFAGFASGAFFPLTVSQAVQRVPCDAAHISSLLTAALMLGSGGGAFLVGALRPYLHIEHIYLVTALLPVIALLLTRWTFPVVAPADLMPTSARP